MEKVTKKELEAIKAQIELALKNVRSSLTPFYIAIGEIEELIEDLDP